MIEKNLAMFLKSLGVRSYFRSFSMKYKKFTVKKS